MIRKIGPTQQTKTRIERISGYKGKRHRSRELALQGLYQWLIAGGTPDAIKKQFYETKEFLKTDQEYFLELMQGTLANITELEKLIQPCLDRSFKELSPIESSILLLSAHEFVNCPETPYRAIINEAIELAKTYGGTDGHKYVNGVLDKLATQIRAEEVMLPAQ